MPVLCVGIAIGLAPYGEVLHIDRGRGQWKQSIVALATHVKYYKVHLIDAENCVRCSRMSNTPFLPASGPRADPP